MNTQQTKNLKIGIGVAGSLLLGYLLFSGGDNGGNQEDPTGNGTIDPSDDFVFNPATIAKQLYEIMKTTNVFGMDEEVGVVLSRLSQTQFGEVFKAFGKRPYNTFSSDQTEWAWQTLPNVDLQGWLKNEITKTKYNFWKLKFPKYLF